MEGHLCRLGVQRREYRYERTPEFSLPLPLNFHSLAVCHTQHSHFWLAWNEEWICLDSQTLMGSLTPPCLDTRRCLMSPRKQLQFFTPPGNPPHKIHPSLLAAPVFLVINFPVSSFINSELELILKIIYSKLHFAHAQGQAPGKGDLPKS